MAAAEGLDDSQLDALLYPPPPAVATDQRPVPDWAEVHRELRRPNMTLALLWEEDPGGPGARDGLGIRGSVTHRAHGSAV